jgi:hypothetical protein
MEDRIRSVVLQITEDMSLTEDMDDTEAMILLEWGSHIARRLTLMTVEMTDDQAREVLDNHIVNLRRTIRRVNSLIGSKRDGASIDDIALKVGPIFDVAAEVPVLQPDKPEDTNQFAAQVSFLSTSGTLRAILARLSPDEQENHE